MVAKSKMGNEFDEKWPELIQILIDEESEIDDLAEATSWLSLNFFDLKPKIKEELINVLIQISRDRPYVFLDLVRCLREEDRENELTLFLLLLQSVPQVYENISHVIQAELTETGTTQEEDFIV